MLSNARTSHLIRVNVFSTKTKTKITNENEMAISTVIWNCTVFSIKLQNKLNETKREKKRDFRLLFSSDPFGNCVSYCYLLFYLAQSFSSNKNDANNNNSSSNSHTHSPHRPKFTELESDCCFSLSLVEKMATTTKVLQKMITFKLMTRRISSPNHTNGQCLSLSCTLKIRSPG